MRKAYTSKENNKIFSYDLIRFKLLLSFSSLNNVSDSFVNIYFYMCH